MPENFWYQTGRAVHAFKVHGHVRAERLVVHGSQCPACLRQYACHSRLCRHLQHSVACFSRPRSEGFQCDALPGIGSRQADLGHDSLAAVGQGAGPLPQCWAMLCPPPVSHVPCRTILEALRCDAAVEETSWGLPELRLLGQRFVRGVYPLICPCLHGLPMTTAAPAPPAWQGQACCSPASNLPWSTCSCFCPFLGLRVSNVAGGRWLPRWPRFRVGCFTFLISFGFAVGSIFGFSA